jgi:hypothetical protein
MAGYLSEYLEPRCTLVIAYRSAYVRMYMSLLTCKWFESLLHNMYIYVVISINVSRALRLTRQSHEKDHAFAGLIALINANPQVDI